MKIVYVAGPFSGKTRWDIVQNVRRAEEAGLALATIAGVMPLVPHKNTENFHGLLTDEFWYTGTLELLRRSDAIFIYDRERSESSRGTQAELEEAERLDLPIFDDVHQVALWAHGHR